MRGQWSRSTSRRTTRTVATRSRRRAAAVVASLALAVAGLLVLQPPAAQSAPTDLLRLNVTSARTEPRAFAGDGVTKGDPVDTYKFLINADTTGGTSQKTPTGPCSPAAADYPNSCDWPSLNAASDSAPIVAQGDQDTICRRAAPRRREVPDLRAGRRLQARRRALHGAHRHRHAGDGRRCSRCRSRTPRSRARSSRTWRPPTAPYDAGDRPLAGFVGSHQRHPRRGQHRRVRQPAVHDVRGREPGHATRSRSVRSTPTWRPVVDTDRRRVRQRLRRHPDVSRTWAPTATRCTSPRDRPARRPADWIQTTTLEGNHDWDTWVMEGLHRLRHRVRARRRAGARRRCSASPARRRTASPCGSAAGHITGRRDAHAALRAPEGRRLRLLQRLHRLQDAPPDHRTRGSRWPTWRTATRPSGSDRRGPTARFNITNVPDGNYTLTWWDEPQNYILALINVTVSRRRDRATMGRLPLNGWWTEYSGYVFNDTNRNGVKDPGEPGDPELHADHAQARQLADGPRPDHGDHRRERLLQLRGRLPARRVRLDRDGGLQRLVLHDRRHLPGRQPDDPDHGQGRRRRRQHAEHHRPGRHHGLGRARLRPDRQPTASTRATAASSARSATTPPATSSTRGTPPRRTGSPASPTSRSSSTPRSTAAPTPARRATPTALRARRRRLLREGQAAQHLRLRELGAADRLHRARRRRQAAGRTACDEDVLARNQETDGECISGLLAERPVRPLRRPTRAPRTPTSARRSTATTASATAASTATSTPRDPANPVCTGGTLRAAAGRRLPGQPRHPRRRRPATRCTRSPARRTSTSATATRSSRRSRRRPAPAPCTPSTSPATAPTATAELPATAPTAPRLASPCPPRRRSTTRPSSTSAARPYEGSRKPLLRHQAGRRSTTASRSCRCSTSSPTCRCPPGCAA